MLTILLVAVLNIIPAGVKTFSLTLPDNKPIQFTKQADGGWKGVKQTGDDPRLFYVTGTKLTMKGGEQEFTQDYAETLGLTAPPNWKELKTLTAGTQLIRIERRPDGLDFVLPGKQDGKDIDRHCLVRWPAEPAPKKD